MCAMQSQPLSENQGMVARSEFNIFDRNPDAALNELTELAAVLSTADYAYIGWMDFGRLWFKAQFGFKAPEQISSATACQWMLEKGEPLLIANAAEDRRFTPQGIPVPGATPCLSYAGTPLITSATKSRALSSASRVISHAADQTRVRGSGSAISAMRLNAVCRESLSRRIEQ